MATAWIHRASASDILVRMNSITEAYEFLVAIAKRYDPTAEIYEEPDTLLDDGCEVAQLNTLQLVIQGPEFDARGWNEDGIVVLLKEEVDALLDGFVDSWEPAGFIPGETETPWHPERRSKAELDAELDEYRHMGEINSLYIDALEYEVYFSSGEWWQIMETEENFLEAKQYKNVKDHWFNVIARGKERADPI